MRSALSALSALNALSALSAVNAVNAVNAVKVMNGRSPLVGGNPICHSRQKIHYPGRRAWKAERGDRADVR